MTNEERTVDPFALVLMETFFAADVGPIKLKRLRNALSFVKDNTL